MIKCVEKSASTKVSGETLSRDALVEEIAASGADFGGENGEHFHTFVYDGPIFPFPFTTERGRVTDPGNSMPIDFRLVRIGFEESFPPIIFFESYCSYPKKQGSIRDDKQLLFNQLEHIRDSMGATMALL